jgi:hypothetical protein
MSNIRYLLDENITPVFRTQLLKSDPRIVVWKMGEPVAPPLGTDDQIILR